MPHSSGSPTQSSTSSQMPSASASAAIAAAHAKFVKLVAVAVAVAFWDVRTSALVWRRTVADAALVEHPRSRQHRRRAIGIGVFCAVTAAHAKASSWFPS